MSDSIFSILNQVDDGEIVLPAIQRDFVWKEESIYKLLDSLMRGYPIGVALLWETYAKIPYREFVKDYKKNNKNTYRFNSRLRKKIVLDGQQRLQSLYIALYGTHENRVLCFDVLSNWGAEIHLTSESKYLFEFFEEKEVETENKSWVEKFEPETIPYYYIQIAELLRMSPAEIRKASGAIHGLYGLRDGWEDMIINNITRLQKVLKEPNAFFLFSVIDQGLPKNDAERKDEAEALEIFIRTNTGGTDLANPDLLFSMLKLNWHDSAQLFPEFLHAINANNSFHLGTDFVIRALFAVSGLSTKFHISLLQNKENVERLRANYEKGCRAIKATIDFVMSECDLHSDKLIGGKNSLIPLVYYLYHQRDHLPPHKEINKLKKLLYVMAFTKVFSRRADSRLKPFMTKAFELNGDGSCVLDLQWALEYILDKENISNFEDLAKENPDLTHHLFQGKRGVSLQYESNSPELDHIFPKARLRARNVHSRLIDDYANLWILPRGRNRNKSKRNPKEYFHAVPKYILKNAAINPRLLSYSSYQAFLKERKAAILKKVKKFVGLSEQQIEKMTQ